MYLSFEWLYLFGYRKPSLSKRLSELAQRVDFNEEEEETRTEDETTSPSTKKASRRWPWEYTHSKLKWGICQIQLTMQHTCIAIQTGSNWSSPTVQIQATCTMLCNGHYYRQALTEVSVLSDVLHMLQTHRQYITTDPVYVPKGPAVPTALQYNMKKKVTM